MKVYNRLTLYILPSIATLIASFFYLTSNYSRLGITVGISVVVLFIMGIIKEKLEGSNPKEEKGEIPNPFK